MGKKHVVKKNMSLFRVSLAILVMVSLIFIFPIYGNLTVQAASESGSSKINLCIKKSVKLKFSNSSSKITWKSSKPSIATVNSKGKVTAKKSGKTVITAKSGKKSSKFVIKVRAHSFSEATCLKAATCKYCGTKKGKPLSTHEYEAATCTTPQKCSVCGKTVGKELGHAFSPSTCTEASVCSRCGEINGEALGHTYTEATCTEPGVCIRCGETGTAALGHTYTEATCTEPGVCIRCGETGAAALGHTYTEATCTEPEVCIRCGVTGAAALGHAYKEATCTEPEVCIRCGGTGAPALGHAYTSEIIKPTKEGKGYTIYSCTRCEDSYKDDFTDFQPDPSQVYRDMIALKEEYPEGMRWTNDNSYFSRALYTTGYGCAAFSFILSDAAFGYLPGRIHRDFYNVKVGDIIRINGDTHSVVAIEVSDGGITLAEGNYNNSIHWGRYMSYGELMACGTYVQTRYPQNGSTEDY